jgi:hypothetical protein
MAASSTATQGVHRRAESNCKRGGLLKAIHAQEDRREAFAKARSVETKLAGTNLMKAAQVTLAGVEESPS